MTASLTQGKVSTSLRPVERHAGYNMLEIGAYEAKTHLAKLLERVERGERFLITKHGRPVAQLVPAAGPDTEAVHQTIADMREFRSRLGRRGFRLGALLRRGKSLRELAHEEHRY